MTDTWKSTYECLRAHLAQHGINDAFRDGGFWLIDDDWGDGRQKICIFNSSIFSRNFAIEIHEKLLDEGIDTEVLVQLEVDPAPPDGLRISAAGIREDWDLKKVREIFGQAFYS